MASVGVVCWRSMCGSPMARTLKTRKGHKSIYLLGLGFWVYVEQYGVLHVRNAKSEDYNKKIEGDWLGIAWCYLGYEVPLSGQEHDPLLRSPLPPFIWWGGYGYKSVVVLAKACMSGAHRPPSQHCLVLVCHVGGAANVATITPQVLATGLAASLDLSMSCQAMIMISSSQSC